MEVTLMTTNICTGYEDDMERVRHGTFSDIMMKYLTLMVTI